MSQRDDQFIQRIQARYPVKPGQGTLPANVVDLSGDPVSQAESASEAEPAAPLPLQCQACRRLFPQGGRNAWEQNVAVADACRRFTCPMRAMLAGLRPA